MAVCPLQSQEGLRTKDQDQVELNHRNQNGFLPKNSCLTLVSQRRLNIVGAFKTNGMIHDITYSSCSNKTQEADKMSHDKTDFTDPTQHVEK